jgi:hypothetical protein
MRFHGLMLLRDEEDIIDECLTHLLTWVDSLFIYDLGSTDSTWEIVQQHAGCDRRIVPAIHQPTIYNDNLRCVLFDKYRERFEPGDWIMKIDSDEFYQISPRDFVKQRLMPAESSVFLQWYFFRLTDREVAEYEQGKDILEDRKKPIAQRRRFYTIPTYSEPRMFRYRRTMKWPQTAAWPYNMGVAARKRIPIRHYPHRDPLQMQRRYRLRHAMMRLTNVSGPIHWDVLDWRKDVFNLDGGNTSGAPQGMKSVAGLTNEELHEWQPGQPLPEVDFTNHLPPAHKRWLQRIASATIVPMLDRRRPDYAKSYQPQIISDDVNRQINSSDQPPSPVGTAHLP